MDKYNHAANRTKVKNALLQFRRKKYLGLNDRKYDDALGKQLPDDMAKYIHVN